MSPVAPAVTQESVSSVTKEAAHSSTGNLLVVNNSGANGHHLALILAVLDIAHTTTSIGGLEPLLAGGLEPSAVIVVDRTDPQAGLHVINVLRGHAVLADVPMALATESADFAVMVHALRSGADEFLLAPVDIDDLARSLQAMGLQINGPGQSFTDLMEHPIV